MREGTVYSIVENKTRISRTLHSTISRFHDAQAQDSVEGHRGQRVAHQAGRLNERLPLDEQLANLDAVDAQVTCDLYPDGIADRLLVAVLDVALRLVTVTGARDRRAARGRSWRACPA